MKVTVGVRWKIGICQLLLITLHCQSTNVHTYTPKCLLWETCPDQCVSGYIYPDMSLASHCDFTPLDVYICMFKAKLYLSWMALNLRTKSTNKLLTQDRILMTSQLLCNQPPQLQKQDCLLHLCLITLKMHHTSNILPQLILTRLKNNTAWLQEERKLTAAPELRLWL